MHIHHDLVIEVVSEIYSQVGLEQCFLLATNRDVERHLFRFLGRDRRAVPLPPAPGGALSAAVGSCRGPLLGPGHSHVPGPQAARQLPRRSAHARSEGSTSGCSHQAPDEKQLAKDVRQVRPGLAGGNLPENGHPPSLDPQYEAEVMQRIEEIDRGTAKMLTLEEVMARLRKSPSAQTS